MLEAIAKKLRKDPSAPSPSPGSLEVTLPPVTVEDADPVLGEVDVFTDATAITVTAETRNADAATVHVSVADGRLFIGLGEGARAIRRDLALPAPVDEERAYATFRNGVLDVVLPRRAQ